MTHRSARSRASLTVFVAAALLNGCDRTAPTTPDQPNVGRKALLTAQDSANFRKTHQTNTPSQSTTADVTTIALRAGERVVVDIVATECSGNPETVKVYGVISQTVAAAVCGSLSGTFDLGTAPSAGNIYFTATHQEFGEGPPGRVTGAAPDYRVGLDDGFNDGDYQDVILAVHVTADNPEPRVECTATPTRGDTVTCNVLGSGTIDVNQWNFTGFTYDGSGQIHISASGGSKTWGGTAVASGTVTADVIADGSARTLTASFAVQPRGWHWNKAANWGYTLGGGPNCFPNEKYQYNVQGLAGWSRTKGTCDNSPIVPDPNKDNGIGYTLDLVPSGPNEGIQYVKSVSFRMDTWSDLVKAIQSGQPPIYTLSKTDIKGCKAKLPTADFYDFNTKCKLINLAPFFTGLWNHEGYGTAGQNNGHQYQLEAAASDPQGDVHSRIERIYGKNMLVDVFVSNEVLSTNIFLNGKWSPEPARTNWCGIDWQWDPTVSLFKQISECY